MTTYSLLALLAIAMLAGVIQSYRLGWYMESAKQYKSRLQAEELRTQSHRESTAWWRNKANWLLQLKQEADMWRNWSRMEVLNERPTLHAKKLRRILNAHFSNQYRQTSREKSGRVKEAMAQSNMYYWRGQCNKLGMYRSYNKLMIAEYVKKYSPRFIQALKQIA